MDIDGLLGALPDDVIVRTDLSDSVVRAFGLSTGLVDKKVCAISEVWSEIGRAHV